MDQYRLLLVGDYPILRHGIRVALGDVPDLVIVGEADDLTSAVPIAESRRPAVLLYGISQVSWTLMQQIASWRQRLPECQVIILTPRRDDELVLAAMRVDAAACLPLSTDAVLLADVIRRVAAGANLLIETVQREPTVAARLVQEYQALTRGDGSLALGRSPLTRRELAVLEQIGHGLTNKEIAQRLGLSEHTIKNYITAILSKLMVEDRTQAALLALRQGWISFESGGRSSATPGLA